MQISPTPVDPPITCPDAYEIVKVYTPPDLVTLLKL
jgi:hypothetical protein